MLIAAILIAVIVVAIVAPTMDNSTNIANSLEKLKEITSAQIDSTKETVISLEESIRKSQIYMKREEIGKLTLINFEIAQGMK